MSRLVAVLAAAGMVALATQGHVGDANPATRAELREQLAKERAVWREREAAYRARLQERVRRPDVQEALALASFIYRVPKPLLERLAWCESRMNPRAYNPSGASGLLQFMPQTWRGNYYGRAGFSVWSPYANALGAAHHIRRYGTGAWDCA